jgi:hypothetical protein
MTPLTINFYFLEQFLNKYKTVNGINGSEQLQIASILLFASLFYAIVCRMQRS